MTGLVFWAGSKRSVIVTATPIVYFSDVLCIWAYVAELRLAAVRAEFGDRVRIEYRACTVFGDSARKIAANWGEADGHSAFNKHLRHVAEGFPEVRVHPGLWLTARPASSDPAHLFVKGVGLDEAAGGCAPGSAEDMLRALRRAFFEEGRDVAQWDVLCDVARATGLDPDRIAALTRSGAAFAALATAYQDARTMGIQGSPSFVLNDGRQKLYGNVGFRILEANILELLRTPSVDQASWC